MLTSHIRKICFKQDYLHNNEKIGQILPLRGEPKC